MAPPASGEVQQRPGRQQQQQGIGQTITGVIRMAVFWYFAMKFFSPKKPPAEPSQLMSNLFSRSEPLVRPPPPTNPKLFNLNFRFLRAADCLRTTFPCYVCHRLIFHLACSTSRCGRRACCLAASSSGWARFLFLLYFYWHRQCMLLITVLYNLILLRGRGKTAKRHCWIRRSWMQRICWLVFPFFPREPIIAMFETMVFCSELKMPL